MYRFKETHNGISLFEFQFQFKLVFRIFLKARLVMLGGSVRRIVNMSVRTNAHMAI